MVSSFFSRILYRRTLRRAQRWRRRALLAGSALSGMRASITYRRMRAGRLAASRNEESPAEPPSLSTVVSADDVFSLPELCAIILRPTRTQLSDLKAVASIASASAVCSTWHAAVASSLVWRSACLARWPSTLQLPLVPTTDYRRLYQSRAVAQRLDPPEMTRTDIYFLLEMRSRDGRPFVSECLSLGACRVAQGCTFVWELPNLVLPRSWAFEGCGLWRRTDSLVHGFGEWSMARRHGGATCSK